MCTKPVSTNSDLEAPSEQQLEHLEIPEPDAENITVFTHNLPNKPILPWNHYDSPWEEVGDRGQGDKEDKEDKGAEKQRSRGEEGTGRNFEF